MHLFANSILACVICRIGSLEMLKIILRLASLVICRIGSLESLYIQAHRTDFVICRIGSLEIILRSLLLKILVICRIGSLENSYSLWSLLLLCYLPYRQLRKSKSNDGQIGIRLSAV